VHLVGFYYKNISRCTVLWISNLLTFQSIVVTVYTTRFNIQRYHISPTQCIDVFYTMILRNKTALISLNSINRLVFMTDADCIYCAVRAEYLRIIQEMLGFEMLVFRPLISAISFYFLLFKYSSGINHSVRSFFSSLPVDRSSLSCVIGHRVTTVRTWPSPLNQRPPRFC
jgi:hypothetical protein